MPHAIKRLLQVLELSFYATLFSVVASGVIDTHLTLTNTYEIPLYAVIGVATVLLILGALSWYHLLDAPRTLFIASLFFLLLFKYSDYGLVSIPVVLSNNQAFILSFAPILLLFSARGKWSLWLGAIALFWAGYLFNLTLHFEEFKASNLEFAFMATAFSFISFLSSFARPPIKPHGGMQIVPAKMAQSSLEVEEESSTEERPRKTAIQLAVDDSDGGEMTNTLGFSASAEGTSEVEQALGHIVYIMNIVFAQAQTCTAYLYDERSNSLILTNYHSSFGINDRISIGQHDGFVGRVIEKKTTQSSQKKPLYSQELKYYKENTKITSILVVPIISREKEFFGALAIDSPNSMIFKDNHTEALRKLATVAGELLLNVRLRQLQEVNARRSQLLYDSSQKFTTSKNSMEILDYLLQFISTTDRVFRTSAVVVDRTKPLVTIVKVLGEKSDYHDGFVIVPTTTSLIVATMQQENYLYEPSFQISRRMRPLFNEEEQIAPYTQSILVVPLGEIGSGHETYIIIESLKMKAFPSEVIDSYVTLIRNGASAMEKAHLYDQLNKMATTDGLTKLFNHRHFQTKLHEHIMHSGRYKRPLSLLLMDIDHFKNFNDTYGHQVGDQVLKQLAQTIEASIRTSDIAARYGGEEFVVILPETDVEDAIGLAERIRQAVSLMIIQVGNENLHVSVSIGVSSLFHHASTQEQLIGYADAAMYISKKDGRNRVTVFQPWMIQEQ